MNNLTKEQVKHMGSVTVKVWTRQNCTKQGFKMPFFFVKLLKFLLQLNHVKCHFICVKIKEEGSTMKCTTLPYFSHHSYTVRPND